MTPKKEENSISFSIKKEEPSPYNEHFESTLGNIHAMAIFTIKNYGRLGYQIKILGAIVSPSLSLP